MTISITLQSNELDAALLAKIRSLFAGEEITLTVAQRGEDTTALLLQDPVLMARAVQPATRYLSFDEAGFAALAADLEAA
jgi:hypothetical protein